MNSKAKGKRGELMVVHWLNDNFNVDARRGQQYCGANGDADVVGGFPNTHPEVKFVEKLNINKAMKQALSDCGESIAYVVSKTNRHDMLVTVRAKDLMAFCEAVVSVKEKNGSTKDKL